MKSLHPGGIKEDENAFQKGIPMKNVLAVTLAVLAPAVLLPLHAEPARHSVSVRAQIVSVQPADLTRLGLTARPLPPGGPGEARLLAWLNTPDKSGSPKSVPAEVSAVVEQTPLTFQIKDTLLVPSPAGPPTPGPIGTEVTALTLLPSVAPDGAITVQVTTDDAKTLGIAAVPGAAPPVLRQSLNSTRRLRSGETLLLSDLLQVAPAQANAPVRFLLLTVTALPASAPARR